MKSDDLKEFDVSVSDWSRVDSWFRNYRRLESLQDKVTRILRHLQHGIGNDPERHQRCDVDSVTYWESVLRRLRDLAACRLDEISTIPSEMGKNPNWTDDAEWIDSISSEVREYLRKSRVSCAERMVGAQLEEVAAAGRRSEYISRMRLELAEAEKRNRYCVFWTLTVDNRSMDQVFSVGSRAFEIFITRLKRASGGEVRYIALPEIGGKTGRPHYHALMFLDKLPSGCVDPNRRHGANGWLREIDKLKSFWPFGMNSEAVAVRWPGDAYSQDGWFWPCQKKKPGVPVVSGRGRLANYMTKYLAKETEGREWKKSGYKQRVRMSRGFGLEKVQEQTRSMTDEQLKAASVMPIQEVPCGRLIKREARLEWLKRNFREALNERESLKNFRSAELKMVTRTSLFRRVLSSIQGTPVYSVPNATPWVDLITVGRLCEEARAWRKRVQVWLAEAGVPPGGVTKSIRSWCPA